MSSYQIKSCVLNSSKSVCYRILFSIIMILSLPLFADASGYISVGGGGGGEADEANISLDFGKFSTTFDANSFLALGIGVIGTKDQAPEYTLDYSIPHSDYTDMGYKPTGAELAIYVKYGIEIAPGSGFYIFGLGGFSTLQEAHVVQSNVTGWYYTESTMNQTYGLGGGGIGFFRVDKPVCFQVEYDNRRGVTGSVGLRW